MGLRGGLALLEVQVELRDLVVELDDLAPQVAQDVCLQGLRVLRRRVLALLDRLVASDFESFDGLRVACFSVILKLVHGLGRVGDLLVEVVVALGMRVEAVVNVVDSLLKLVEVAGVAIHQPVLLR